MDTYIGNITRWTYLFIIIVYFFFGLTWLYRGNLIIDIIDKHYPKTNLHFLHFYKDISFLILTGIVLFFLLRNFQRRLLHAETNYIKLFESSPGAVYVVDKSNYRFLAVNDVMARTYGYSKTELLKMTALDIRPQSERKKLKEYLNFEQDKHHERGVWLHQKRNGVCFYMLISHHCLKFSGKDAFAVIAIDVDRSIRNEIRLKKIAWSNSHEIRKPVSNILGLVELMKNDLYKGTTDPSLVEMLVNSAYELDAIVKKINLHAAELDKT